MGGCGRENSAKKTPAPCVLFGMTAQAKVADFGLSNFNNTMRSSATATMGGGTLAWSAPETFDGHFDEHSDAFSCVRQAQNALGMAFGPQAFCVCTCVTSRMHSIERLSAVPKLTHRATRAQWPG